ncbi:DUF6166 domain-containing protein [Sorangium sp. So ce448]|uniref:DUF6166 domain-containing protein n=1 Tax=Sorangium sp. So ce448 TaxID=3133314 RepID=UPI003F5F8D3C
MSRACAAPLRQRTTSRLTSSKPPSEPRTARALRLDAITYFGVQAEHGVMVIRSSGARAEQLPARDVDGTPVPLGWGYFGTGPLELASALLSDAIGPEAARRFGWSFCVLVTALLPGDGGWSLTRSEVRAHARAAGWR